MTEEQFNKENEQTLAQALYEEALTNYNRKKEELARQALPVFQNIRNTQGGHIENVIVPFTDGRKGMQVLASLDKTLQTQGRELLAAMERSITLGIIDDSWKEHLRAMDDLKQSVQTASYEQKDPLVIYKLEAFNLFKRMESALNKDIVQFLCHSGIPVEQQQDIREGREQKTDLSQVRQQKSSLDSRGIEEIEHQEYNDPSEAQVKQQPVVVGPKIGRNDPCPCGSGKKYKQCHGR
ncbi:MAG TPA: SEC-C metal-binding domain-containing protein [Phnomibacter sp.]|nr:SEC-C metal-binding domain-containing protein [Phnomibacter sp.]